MADVIPVSMNKEIYTAQYDPALAQVSDLIINHPNIPEEIDQVSLVTAIRVAREQIGNLLDGKDEELDKLRKDNEAQAKLIKRTQELNQQLNIQVGAMRSEQMKKIEEPVVVKKSWEEINKEYKRFLDA